MYIYMHVCIHIMANKNISSSKNWILGPLLPSHIEQIHSSWFCWQRILSRTQNLDFALVRHVHKQLTLLSCNKIWNPRYQA